MMNRKTFRELHTGKLPLILPAAHDALSARLIEAAGFQAMAGSGSGMLAARFALPDLGIAGLGEMLAANRDVIEATSLPCLVDVDDGYGDVKSVARTVRATETIGAAAIVFEDQSRASKQPGQNTAQAVVSDEEISAKLRVALQTRDSSDFWIYGRTDAYATEGIEGALRRAELYLKVGVDGLFVAGVKTEEDLVRVGNAFAGTPLIVVMYGTKGWPSLSPAELGGLGFTQIVYPLMLLLPMCEVMTAALADLKSAADTSREPRLIGDELNARRIFQKAVRLEQWEAIG